MLYGRLGEHALMDGLPPRVKHILDEIDKAKLEDAEPGIYELADGTSYKVAQYTTMRDRRFAGHSTYADLTYIIEGTERFTVADKASVSPTDYDAEKDVRHYTGVGKDYILCSGMFILLAPGDIHRTKQAVAEPEKAKSAMFKIPWDKEEEV